jgi:hypothetical protein
MMKNYKYIFVTGDIASGLLRAAKLYKLNENTYLCAEKKAHNGNHQLPISQSCQRRNSVSD